MDLNAYKLVLKELMETLYINNVYLALLNVTVAAVIQSVTLARLALIYKVHSVSLSAPIQLIKILFPNNVCNVTLYVNNALALHKKNAFLAK